MTFHSLSGSIIIMEYSLPKTSITLFALPIAIDMCAAERSSNRMTPLKKRKTVAQRDTASHPGIRALHEDSFALPLTSELDALCGENVNWRACAHQVQIGWHPKEKKNGIPKGTYS